MVSMTDEVKTAGSIGQETHRTEYLGDGLYAGLDGDMICLSCDREDGEHIVFLDSDGFVNLLRFASKEGWTINGRR